MYVVACGWGYFRCVAGGTCLSSYRRCNGRCDCPYCTDELNCYTPPSSPNITTRQPSVPTWYQPYAATSSRAPQYPWFNTTYRPLLSYSKFIVVNTASMMWESFTVTGRLANLKVASYQSKDIYVCCSISHYYIASAVCENMVSATCHLDTITAIVIPMARYDISTATQLQ